MVAAHAKLVEALQNEAIAVDDIKAFVKTIADLSASAKLFVAN